MRALVPVTNAYERLSRRGARRQPPVRAVDRTLRLVVDEVVHEAADVISLRLVDPSGAPLPLWQPGCHLDVLLPSGRRRQYSLCGDPADRRAYRIAVRRIDGGDGGSVEVHATLRKGSSVAVQGPRNAFPFLDVPSYLFLAGGIGITPILPMVRAAQARGADWRLVYTGRSRASMPFLAELSGDRVVVRTDDESGVPDPVELLAHAPDRATVYCCGPVPMIDGVRAVLGRRPLHFERFSPPPVVGGEPFVVRLARTGVTVPVASDRSVLAAVREVLPSVAYSCQQGFCGTCRVRVLPGEDEMSICRDRGSGLVVLDL
ncbi:PDR/VanB family oxidoreductase [Labedaea rhizosphaerae]|nr:PDR/VanB family oxidoreductase [Labedaea rhizosphaerae]